MNSKCRIYNVQYTQYTCCMICSRVSVGWLSVYTSLTIYAYLASGKWPPVILRATIHNTHTSNAMRLRKQSSRINFILIRIARPPILSDVKCIYFLRFSFTSDRTTRQFYLWKPFAFSHGVCFVYRRCSFVSSVLCCAAYHSSLCVCVDVGIKINCCWYIYGSMCCLLYKSNHSCL